MTQLQMDRMNPAFKIGDIDFDSFKNDLYQQFNNKMNIKKVFQTAGVVASALFIPTTGTPVNHYPSSIGSEPGFRIQSLSGRVEAGEKLTNDNQDVVNSYTYSYTVTKPNYSVFLGTRQEAIELEFSQPSLFSHEKTIKSRVINAGFFEPTLSEDFTENTWDEFEDNSQLFKFEKKIKSKVVYGGDFEFPALD
ncbi:hypothetical protein CN533_27215 [Priestia megaterium]|uniref:hypothetical protein n=1 Tax=Priestia megaterium TaxID=1404 RepID=UPI000BF75951|nr:hypothetical protein [Priestia megaterium]PET68281.1 hypothetical protein CN533_27215 [Priestia megaterium]PFK82634.1 hypothetical protein COJ19_25760 [Priestia megaterium]